MIVHSIEFSLESVQWEPSFSIRTNRREKAKARFLQATNNPDLSQGHTQSSLQRRSVSGCLRNNHQVLYHMERVSEYSVSKMQNF